MRILFIGDIVGPQRARHRARAAARPDRATGSSICVVINGENAAGGFGITEAIYNEFIDAGADAVTLGNHAWDQREALVFIERAPRLMRPINYPRRHAGPRRGADRGQERRARARHQRHGPHLHGPARRSVRRDRARACRLPAQERRRRHHHRHARRGDQREAGDGLFLRRPRQPRGRHAHPCADRRPPHPAGRHRLHVRRRHDRRLRFGHRHGQGRAAQPLPAPHSVRAGSSRRPARRRCARSRSRPTTRPASRAASRRCGSAARLEAGAAGVLGASAFWILPRARAL